MMSAKRKNMYTFMDHKMAPTSYGGFDLEESSSGNKKLACQMFRPVTNITLEECAMYTESINGNAFNFRTTFSGEVLDYCEPLICEDDYSTIAATEPNWLMYYNYKKVHPESKILAHIKPFTATSVIDSLKADYPNSEVHYYDLAKEGAEPSIQAQLIIPYYSAQDVFNLAGHEFVASIEFWDVNQLNYKVIDFNLETPKYPYLKVASMRGSGDGTYVPEMPNENYRETHENEDTDYEYLPGSIIKVKRNKSGNEKESQKYKNSGRSFGNIKESGFNFFSGGSVQSNKDKFVGAMGVPMSLNGQFGDKFLNGYFGDKWLNGMILLDNSLYF
eukprot:Awhi_evm1s2012